MISSPPRKIAWLTSAVTVAMLFALASPGRPGDAGKSPRRPVVVKIEDEKPVVVEADHGPVDNVQRINYQPAGPMNVRIATEQGQNLHLSHFPTMSIDGQIRQGFNAGIVQAVNMPLPKVPGGRERRGYTSTWTAEDLRWTMTVEVVPTKPEKPGAKRQLDSVMVRYLVENKGNRARKVGLRIYIDTYIVDNDGAQFASPTSPAFKGRVIDGVQFKDKEVPPYVQVLQRPNLQAPGYVAHLTLDLLEKPSRLVLTRHGFGFNTWDMPAQASMGDSALGFFWEPRDIPPGGKRDMAYAYGKGVASKPGGDGHFNVLLGGNFEPGKQFTISAFVPDAAPGQSLALALPPGMERSEGKEIQPVPFLVGQEGQSMVMWKARATKLGRFPVQIRSNTGITQTKIVTISKGD